MQKVDTSGVPPLQWLRDETEAGRREATIGLEELKDAFGKEELCGKYYKRIRRRRDVAESDAAEEQWDVLGHAERKVGRYFVAEGGKKD